MKYFATILLFSIPFIAAYAQVSGEYVIGELNWAQACFRITNITATATVHVTDSDMNKFSGSTDTIRVFVYSDSYPEGTTLTLYETDLDSGIFERTFGLSDQRSAPSVLYTQEGDTITAKYVDATLPPPHTSSDHLELSSTAFIGCSSPPLERVPASTARIVDSVGNTIDRPAVGEQVHITSDIANGQSREQKFAWLTQIMDEQNKVVSLGWIDGVLNAESSFSPSMSWIPEKIGQYTATMFVWESLDNPTALSPPLSIEFDVGPQELRNQRYGYDEMFLFIIPQENFKTHISTEKLAKLHFYKIAKDDLTNLPRLDLLLDMLRYFPAEYLDEMAVRINDSILTQYAEFFHQKCLQRTFANDMICQNVDMAFEFEEEWYLLDVSGRPNVVLEESTPSWDEDFFKRYKPYDFYNSRENRSGVSLDRSEGVPPKKQAELGAEIWCKLTFVLTTKVDGTSACVTPETKQKLIERGWAKAITTENTSGLKDTEMDTVKKLLSQNQIEYLPDKLIVTGGPVFYGDQRCGAVMDINNTTHWFAIDSISKPQKMALYSENPNQCQVNTGSCFCNAQIELTALTLDELSYFSPEEEEKFANMLIDYLVKENINRTPKFMIGKFNINYTDPSAIGYCGELWGYNAIDYFGGAIANDQVKDYGLDKELSPLCAISEDAKWWE